MEAARQREREREEDSLRVIKLADHLITLGLAYVLLVRTRYEITEGELARQSPC